MGLYASTGQSRLLGNSKNCALKRAFGPMEQQSHFITFSLGNQKNRCSSLKGGWTNFGQEIQTLSNYCPTTVQLLSNSCPGTLPVHTLSRYCPIPVQFLSKSQTLDREWTFMSKVCPNFVQQGDQHNFSNWTNFGQTLDMDRLWTNFGLDKL